MFVSPGDQMASPAPTATPVAAQGSGPGASDSQGPRAYAGMDAQVILGRRVSFSGEAIGFPAGAPNYCWSFAGLPHDSALGPEDISGADGPNASFTPDVDGTYYLDMTASIPGLSFTDRVAVTAAYDLNRPPEAYIDYYFGNYCQPGECLIIIPIASDPEHDGVRYSCRLESQPEGSSLGFGDDAAVYYSHGLPRQQLWPTVEGSYTIRLTATDTKGAEASALSSFTVKARNPSGNSSPIANAGTDLRGFQNSAGTLTRPTQSYDLDGDALSYSWRCISYPASFPAQAASALAFGGPTFTLNMGLPTGDYVFELTVDDGTVQGEGDEPPTATDTMTFTIRDTPAQILNADTDGMVAFGGIMVMMGVTMQRDPDISCDPSQTVSYAFLAKPAASASTLSYSFAPEYTGSYANYSASFPLDAPGRYIVAATFRDYAHTFTRIFSIAKPTNSEGGIDVSVY
jgi:hypothetical protein